MGQSSTGEEYSAPGLYCMLAKVYLKHSEAQRMSQLVFVDDEGASTAALHTDAGEGVQLRVHPVEPLVQQIWGEEAGLDHSHHGERIEKKLESRDFTKCNSIRPLDVVSDQSSSVSPVKTCHLNLSGVPPVSPINKAGRRRNCCKRNIVSHIKDGKKESLRRKQAILHLY